MHDCYSRIFSRLGLKFRAVAADTGAIGGTGSHEFHVLADSGEDAIAYCPSSDYAANIELAEAVSPATKRPAPAEAMQKVATPGKHSIEEVCEFLKIPAHRVVKTLLLEGRDGDVVALLLRGDHQLNEVKAGKLLQLAQPLRFAADAQIRAAAGCNAGSLGPVGLNVTLIADRAVAAMGDFVCGANEDGHHLTGVNFGRDLPEPKELVDLRNVAEGDDSPDGKGKLELCRGIEVGHIFQLRTKYSEAMKATFLDENGKEQVMEMGCYGIGVSRIVAAAIEQGHDEHGIVFPPALAPFQLAIVPIGINRSELVKETVEKLYAELMASGIEVLLDDRDERPGVMFADLELIGIPHRIVIGERGLKDGNVEYQGRRDDKATAIPLQNIVSHIKSVTC
jgi:prolyl-tRNA synthetase